MEWVFIPLLIIFLSWFRSEWANNRTYKQRMEMLDAMEMLTGREHDLAMQGYRMVSYQEHKREIFWGRDPYWIYQGAARKLINRTQA